MRERAFVANAAVAGAGTVTDAISKNDLAAQTENPELWIHKYDFYVDQLGFTKEQAIKWAFRTVRLDEQIKQALKLNGHFR